MRAPVGVADFPLAVLVDQRDLEVIKVRRQPGGAWRGVAPGHADLQLDPRFIGRGEFQTLDAREQVDRLVRDEVAARVAAHFGPVLALRVAECGRDVAHQLADVALLGGALHRREHVPHLLLGRGVVGAGGEQKRQALLDDFGFDVALDHRSPTFADDLADAVPDGIDVYFENVGGAVAREAFKRMNLYGRVPVCGLVADYNATSVPEGPNRLPAFMRLILSKSLNIRGFIQTEFVESHGRDFVRDMSAWVADGSVRYREDVVEGLESVPEAFRGLLTGNNFGKLLVRVSPDPTL